MSLNYGSAFASKWGSLDIEDLQWHWIDGLSDYSATVIKNAVRSLDDSPFPPSLPEFKTLCKAHSRSSVRCEALNDSSNLSPIEAAQALKIIQEMTGIPLENGQTDKKKWAKDIQAGWNAGTYRHAYGYRLSCEVTGIAPGPRGPKKPPLPDRYEVESSILQSESF